MLSRRWCRISLDSPNLKSVVSGSKQVSGPINTQHSRRKQRAPQTSIWSASWPKSALGETNNVWGHNLSPSLRSPSIGHPPLYDDHHETISSHWWCFVESAPYSPITDRPSQPSCPKGPCFRPLRWRVFEIWLEIGAPKWSVLVRFNPCWAKSHIEVFSRTVYQIRKLRCRGLPIEEHVEFHEAHLRFYIATNDGSSDEFAYWQARHQAGTWDGRSSRSEHHGKAF